MIMEACARERGDTNCNHFLEGSDLSIVFICCCRGEDFQRRAQHFWSWVFCFWRIAETFSGRGFRRCFGRSDRGEGSFLAAFLACSSAMSFGSKSTWPGTHWIFRFTTPLVRAIFVRFCLRAARKSLAFCSLSCLEWSHSTALCM